MSPVPPPADPDNGLEELLELSRLDAATEPPSLAAGQNTVAEPDSSLTTAFPLTRVIDRRDLVFVQSRSRGSIHVQPHSTQGSTDRAQTRVRCVLMPLCGQVRLGLHSGPAAQAGVDVARAGTRVLLRAATFGVGVGVPLGGPAGEEVPRRV